MFIVQNCREVITVFLRVIVFPYRITNASTIILALEAYTHRAILYKDMVSDAGAVTRMAEHGVKGQNCHLIRIGKHRCDLSINLSIYLSVYLSFFQNIFILN